jgi:tetratricopeptide (TPR) repeat protein
MSGLGEQKMENSLGVALRRLLEAQGGTSGWRSAPADPAAYDEIFNRMTKGIDEKRQRLAAERKDAGARWEALESHPQTRRQVRIANDRRFQTWGFHQFLVTRSRKLVEHEPKKALEAAELALAVAKALSPAEHGEERTADFRAAAWMAIADARGRLGDLDSAWDAVDCAEEALEEGTGDPLDKAELEQIKARLFQEAGRDEEAERAHRRAVNMFRRIGDRRVLEEPGHRSRREVHGRAARG